MSQHTPEQPPSPEQKPSAALILFGIAFLMYAIAVGLYFYLAYLESTGQSGTVHIAVALLYNLGGKWTVAGFFGVGGTIILIIGIADLFAPKSKK